MTDTDFLFYYYLFAGTIVLIFLIFCFWFWFKIYPKDLKKLEQELKDKSRQYPGRVFDHYDFLNGYISYQNGERLTKIK